jgi:hypothetical protein
VTKPLRREGLLALTFVGFVSLGLPDGLLGVAWPSMRADFALPLSAIGPLLVSFVAGYVGSSFVSGRAVAAVGIGRLLAASAAATAASLAVYATSSTPASIPTRRSTIRRGRSTGCTPSTVSARRWVRS